MNRRTLLSAFVKFFGIGTASLLAFPPFRFIKTALGEREDQMWRTVLNNSDSGLTEEVSLVRLSQVIRDGWMIRTTEQFVWVRRKEDRTFEVFDPHCTHLGCSVSWNREMRQFQCPCHGGKFDIEGKRVAGPPPRPLDVYETRVQGDALQIGALRKKV